jgi:anti-sigma B factor antagonist
MAQLNPRIKASSEGNVIIVELADKKILDEMNIAQIGEQLNRLVAQTPDPRMVLDFANVAHMSSSALGMLITLNKRIRERRGQLRLCNIQPAIYEVFVITRLSEIFNVAQDRQQAIAELKTA